MNRTKEVFGARIVDESGKESADTFLKTGDLGFVNQEGELFITGRQKDVILIRYEGGERERSKERWRRRESYG